ncbi:hypothetical protein GALL_207790 [mine drainage metagenome]|uniref:Baseplate protein J-like barrel domain-containing protein n=1 Tax=mine drainage metagenome TaxID=410659 RepID=A0A1J5RNB5_9ZZZZ
MTSYTTNVPAPSFGDTGFIVPTEAAILAGVQADQLAAFGSDLNTGLTTPQGQLATSETAILADCYDQFVALVNGVDPAYASGRMQDAIGRLYGLTRIAATATTVTATCAGLPGTVIPVGAQAQDQAGNLYLATEAGTIPSGGGIDLTFQCAVTGPIACPAGYLSGIYQAIPGWDSVTNAAAGVAGSDVESRAAFEARRQQSVAGNAQGTPAAVLAAVLAVPGVLDAYAMDNPLAATSGAVITGSISGTTLTVTAADSRWIGGQVGAVTVGQMVTGGGVAQGTYITALGTGSGGAGTYTVNLAQAVAAESLTCAQGGVPLAANSLYVAAYGGAAAEIGAAIWAKKSPGCGYTGNTTVTVTDDGGGVYSPPYPSYPVSFQIPTPTPVLVAVSLRQNAAVPSNAVTLVQNAVLAAFSGEDGGERARIGAALYASRFFTGIAALGAWAQINAVLVGVGAATQPSVLLRIDQVPTLQAAGISVVFS